MKKLIAVFIVLSCFISIDVVLAQENKSKGVGVSPLTFELTANPGDTIGNELRIYNPTSGSVLVKMEAEDFLPVGEEGKVVTTSEEDEDTTYSLRKWIIITPSEFTLKKGEEKFVNFAIEVPANAEPGGKYGSILAGVSGAVSEDGTMTSTSVATKTGALVLLMVSGNLNEKLAITDFSAPSFQEYGPVPFEIRFENTGTVHVKPKGYIVIADWFGKKVVEFEFPQKNVMPGAARKIESQWGDNSEYLSSGFINKFIEEVKYDFKNFAFGKYTASVIGVYGTSNKNLTSQVITFWVFPWKLMLGVLIALIIIITFFFKTRKRWRTALKILLKGEAR
jgi:hypothetical protein